MPKINQEEYEILKELDDERKWVARNYNGALITYTDKPTKNPNLYWDSFGERMDDRLFQFIQWADPEPYNISELIEEYESEETEVKKDIEWLRKDFDRLVDQSVRINSDKEWDRGWNFGWYEARKAVYALTNQLDEPDVQEAYQEGFNDAWNGFLKDSEILSQDWINEHAFDSDEYFSARDMMDSSQKAVAVENLQNLLVPKQEEVDRAYKDGESETVADVVITFWKSYERLKEVMSMEVKELEE